MKFFMLVTTLLGLFLSNIMISNSALADALFPGPYGGGGGGSCAMGLGGPGCPPPLNVSSGCSYNYAVTSCSDCSPTPCCIYDTPCECTDPGVNYNTCISRCEYCEAFGNVGAR